MSRRMSLISDWNTVGAFVSPKGMTKCPNGVWKAVFHSSPSQIRTKWYAQRRSSLEKIWARWRGAKAASRRGSGYLFLTVAVKTFITHGFLCTWLDIMPIIFPCDVKVFTPLNNSSSQVQHWHLTEMSNPDTTVHVMEKPIKGIITKNPKRNHQRCKGLTLYPWKA